MRFTNSHPKHNNRSLESRASANGAKNLSAQSKLPVVMLVVIATVVLIAGGLLFARITNNSTELTEQTPNSQHNASSSPDAQKSTIRIIATGDVIPHDALNAAAKNNGDYDYYQFMKNLQPYFDAADVRFCNQAVLGAGEKYGIRGYPIFNSPTQVARDMQKIGCNVINTGSNHTNDLAQAEINASVSVWDDLPSILAVAGANRNETEKQQVRYFEVNGVKFAFLSYVTYSNAPSTNSYSITTFSEPLAKKQLAEARKKADIVMVSMRWGTEYSAGVNPAQDAQSKFLAKNGADIVLGHGPHVLEPVKKLSGKNGRPTYVWFSLGNFLNAQTEVESLVSGLAVMDIDTDAKQITSVGYLPIYMHYEWTAAQKVNEDLMARRGFSMYLLEDAAEPLAKSQLNTTVDAQRQRVQSVLNKYTNVPLLSGEEYLRQ